ncbi:unnamed protein product [Mytilus coruscus]|uniref:Uncharacterized protein n=1 Tax=Mytilus coruscus TaxID=42192 RepID=A0A6J8B1K6_MYTCO|nr:unnamed protein product [Mytilus coruscus]
MTELGTNPLEQLDLLIKFWGPSSQQHAQNIRCANANNPATAMRLIWERLDARFVSPQMIESSLHPCIVNFPTLSNNNRKEFYKLADLAAEIESIRKDEKFATTFAYFDSSLGVNRFVTRLPYSIQEKWTTTANGYNKSCPKIELAKVYHSDRPDYFKTVYCVIDDQSNRTLATSDFFNFFGKNDTETEYVLASCAGRFVTSGRRASGYVLASLDGSSWLNVPEIIECNDIPNNGEEIPSSVVASSYPHMMDIASCIPDIDNQSEKQILIGRDLIRAHHVIEHRVGADQVPYAQRLPLGWAIVGNVCLGRFHGQKVVNVNKTVILGNGRPTLLSPCDSEMSIKLDPIFDKTKLDEKEGVSIEDQTFLNIMSSGFFKQDDGHWIAPLPFKPNKLL